MRTRPTAVLLLMLLLAPMVQAEGEGYYPQLSRHSQLGPIRLLKTPLQEASSILGGAPIRRAPQEHGDAYVCAHTRGGAVVRLGSNASGGWSIVDSLEVAQHSGPAQAAQECPTEAPAGLTLQNPVGLRLGLRLAELKLMLGHPTEWKEADGRMVLTWWASQDVEREIWEPKAQKSLVLRYDAFAQVQVELFGGQVVRYQVFSGEMS